MLVVVKKGVKDVRTGTHVRASQHELFTSVLSIARWPSVKFRPAFRTKKKDGLHRTDTFDLIS